MPYDLAAMTTRKRDVTLRPIHITAALEDDLYRIAVRPTRAWEREVRETVLPAYRLAREVMEAQDSTITRDNQADELERVITAAEAAAVVAMVGLTADVREWLERTVVWHTGRWRALVRSGAGIDVYPFIDVAANRVYIDAMLQRITSLIRDIEESTRKDVAETVWREFLNQRPPSEVGRLLSQRMGVSRRRAEFIASDQSAKVAAALTRIRQEEAGISKFRWVTTGDDRVRPAHAALNGRVFEWDDPPSEGFPGEPPRCRCTAAAVLEVEGD